MMRAGLSFSPSRFSKHSGTGHTCTFMRSILISILAALALATTLSGCIYRIDIQQGNFLEAKDTDQIAVGMTRSQVQYALGTPMVADPFNSARWDYIYYLKKGRLGSVERRNFTVFFEDNKVARIEKSAQGKRLQEDKIITPSAPTT